MPEDMDRAASSASIPAMGLQGDGLLCVRPLSLHPKPAFPRAELVLSGPPFPRSNQAPAYLSQSLTGLRLMQSPQPGFQHSGASCWAALALHRPPEGSWAPPALPACCASATATTALTPHADAHTPLAACAARATHCHAGFHSLSPWVVLLRGPRLSSLVTCDQVK